MTINYKNFITRFFNFSLFYFHIGIIYLIKQTNVSYKANHKISVEN